MHIPFILSFKKVTLLHKNPIMCQYSRETSCYPICNWQLFQGRYIRTDMFFPIDHIRQTLKKPSVLGNITSFIAYTKMTTAMKVGCHVITLTCSMFLTDIHLKVSSLVARQVLQNKLSYRRARARRIAKCYDYRHIFNTPSIICYGSVEPLLSVEFNEREEVRVPKEHLVFIALSFLTSVEL